DVSDVAGTPLAFIRCWASAARAGLPPTERGSVCMGRAMTRTYRLRTAIGTLLVAFALGSPARAAEPQFDEFRSEIEAVLGRLEPSTNGIVKWVGSDPYEIRRDGKAVVATIANPQLAFRAREFDRLSFDRLEIRRTAERDSGKLVELAILLPTEGT